MIDNESWMSTKQVCVLLSVSSRTLERYRKKFENPFPDPDVSGTGTANRWKRWRVLAWMERESFLSKFKPHRILVAHRMNAVQRDKEGKISKASKRTDD